MKYILTIFFLASFLTYPLLLSDEIDGWSIVACLLVAGFQVLGAVMLYKEMVGWNNFENPEGLHLKRKKEDK